MTGLYQRHRPTKLDDVVGQPEAVAALTKFLKNGNLPHALMLTGGSGVGKSTIARILAVELGAAPTMVLDINCATIDPLDTVRAIQETSERVPMVGDKRVWILEEGQALSRALHSLQALLKPLEDVRDHTYFILCTTDPGKIIKAIKTRCTEIALKSLSEADLQVLVRKVAKAEGAKLSDAVRNKIVDCAEGSARTALVLLEKVMGLPTEKEQLAQLDRGDVAAVAFDLVKAVAPFRGKPVWKDIARILTGIEGEDAEGVRRLVLACARKTLLRGGPVAPHAFRVIQSFRDNLYDSGHAGLAAMCWEVVSEG